MSEGVNAFDKNKWSYERLFSYFEDVANDSEHILDFTRMDIMNLNREKASGLKTPFLGLEDPSFGIKNNTGNNIQWIWQSAFVVAIEVKRQSEAEHRAAMSKAAMIVQKIYARYLHDRRRNAVITFDFSQSSGIPIKQVFRNCVGYRVKFNLPSQFDMAMREADWNNIPDDEGVPPFATVYDSGQANRLGVGDVYTCSTADATIELVDTAGNILSTETAAPGATVQIEAPNTTTTINSQNAGPNGVARAGGTTNIRVVNENNTQIGALNANQDWEAPRGLVRFRDSLNNIIATGTAPPGANDDTVVADVVHTDSDLTPVPLPIGTPMVCTPPPSPPADPSFFADAIALYRSDGSFTLVNNLIDVWADASGNGNHAQADIANDQYRLDRTASVGNFDWIDVIQANQTDFKADVAALVGNITEFAVVLHHRRLGRKAPNTNSEASILDLGNINNQEFMQVRIKNDDITFYIASGANYHTYNIGYGENHNLAVIYDGAEAASADRLKVYQNGVLLTPTSTSGAIPASVACDTDDVYISSIAVSRPTYLSRQLVGLIPRKLTPAEIAEYNTFTTTLWP